jgi:hypothetical protein
VLPRRLRHPALWLGLALVGHGALAVRAWAFPPRDRLVVEVAAGQAVQATVDRALLLEEAGRFRWVERDPVVRGRLAMNLAFLRGEPGFVGEGAAVVDDARVAEALALGLADHDPVVEARLITLAEDRMLADVSRADPGDAALEAYRTAHRPRFVRPGRLRFEERFFSRERRDDPSADARGALGRLRAGEDLGGDPRVLTYGARPVTPAELDRRYGGGFGTAAAALPVDAWAGPVASAYGAHLLRVLERSDEALPPLTRVRAEVLDAWRGERRARLRRERLDALRRLYRVDVRRTR